MDCALDFPKLRLQLDHAIALVPHDRWALSAVRDGRLKVLADSSPEPDRPYRRTRPLTHLGRRCLHERRPVAVSSGPQAGGAASTGAAADWEIDWPALLYAPVGMPAQRPLGLLIVGSRSDHWYRQHEVDYVAALAVAATGLALSVGGPLARLSRRELEAARLIVQGLSVPETSIALQVEVEEARTLVGGALRKLSLRSPGQLIDAWSRLEPTSSCP